MKQVNASIRPQANRPDRTKTIPQASRRVCIEGSINNEHGYAFIKAPKDTFIIIANKIEKIEIAARDELKLTDEPIADIKQEFEQRLSGLDITSIQAESYVLFARAVKDPQATYTPYVIPEMDKDGLYRWGLVLIPYDLGEQRVIGNALKNGRIYYRFTAFIIPPGGGHMNLEPDHRLAEEHYWKENLVTDKPSMERIIDYYYSVYASQKFTIQ